MADFRLTPAALNDLESIWRYTAQQWGLTQAAHYIDQLNEVFEAIAQSPNLASPCDTIRPGYRRFQVERHAVYFRLEAGTVVVVRVLHERMDAPRHQ